MQWTFRKRRLVPAHLALALAWTAINPADAQTAACRAGEADTAAHPAPSALLPALARTFGITADALVSGSYVRCADGRLLACVVGANLACGAANTSRHSVGADAFCRDNPDASVVPMVATGHDTIYAWRCIGTRASAGPPITAVDRQGFIERNWREVQ